MATVAGGRIVLLSAEEDLIGWVQDAAAAAGFAVDAAHSPDLVDAAGASAVLVGTDAAESLRRRGVPRREQALVVGHDGGLDATWALAGEIGAAGAVTVPSGGAWLVQWLHGVGSAAGRTGIVAAVAGAAGGAGASTLAAAIGVCAAASGLDVLLVDANPGPAGVGLLLGDADPAQDWSRFAATRGFLPPQALANLPVLEGVRCLAWGGGPEHQQWQGAVGSVVGAASGHDLVLLDVGVDALGWQEMPRRTRPIIVVPASSRGVLAARTRLRAVRAAFDAPAVVVLRDIGGRTDPRSFRRYFEGCEVIPAGFDPGVIDDEEHCRPPGTRPRSAIGRTARQIIAALLAGAAAA